MNDPAEAPYVREELDARSLHFSMSAIQSRMHLQRPDALELEYTRTMMAWSMLRPEARELCMIGLGGGSIAKFCHRHLPRCAMTVVEVDPRVIALRTRFQVPPDDARLSVVEDDGARYLARTERRFDVLLVDAFDAVGLPAALGTQRFFDDCFDALRDDGLFVVNLHAGDPLHPAHVARIERSFGASVVKVPDRDGSNTVLFAVRNGSFQGRAAAARRPPSGSPMLPAPIPALRGAFSRLARALAAARDER